MNYMKEIAHMLGLEIGEEFKIEGPNNYKYRFDDNLMTLMPDGRWCTAPAVLNKILEGKYKIIKPILTEEEKEYLSYVIKPFRDRIKYIYKYPYEKGDFEAIVAMCTNGNYHASFNFPAFEKNTIDYGKLKEN